MKHLSFVRIIFTLIGFGLIILGAFKRPDWLLKWGMLTWLPGYFLLLCMITPLGGVRLSTAPGLPWLSWFAKLLSAQLLVLILSVSALVAFMGGGPQYTKGLISPSIIVETLVEHQPTWGIFPWGIYLFWGLVIAYVAYIKKGVPYIYRVSLSPRWLQPLTKAFVESACMTATLFAVCLTATIIILLLTYFIQLFMQVHHFFVPVISVTVVSFVFLIFAFPRGRQIVERHYRKVKSVSRAFSFLILVCIVALVLASWINKMMMLHSNLPPSKLVCNQCTAMFTNIPIADRFASLYWGWWLMWAPLAGSYLAKISVGRTIRQVIAGVYIVPLCIAILWLLNKQVMVNVLFSLAGIPLPILLLLLAFGSWVCLRVILEDAQTSEFFLTGYMSTPEDAPRHRLLTSKASKITGMSKLIKRFWALVISTIFLHTMAGWFGIQFQMIMVGAFIIGMMYETLFFWAIQLFKDRAFFGNRNIRPY